MSMFQNRLYSGDENERGLSADMMVTPTQVAKSGLFKELTLSFMDCLELGSAEGCFRLVCVKPDGVFYSLMSGPQDSLVYSPIPRQVGYFLSYKIC